MDRTWVGKGLLLGSMVLVACSDSTEPTPDIIRDPGALNILQLAQNAPPLWNSQASFYAVRGEGREARLFFQDATGGRGEEYLRLKIPGPSLLTRPDGTPFSVGDSILITVTVVDVQQILFELEPSGLRFDPAKPAELDIEYQEAGDDYDQDGDVDAEDDRIETELAIWRQEVAGGVFERLGSVKFEDLKEIDVELTGFTRYAIAY
ncbi:MAG: hypothetical protein E2O47_03560 [Gemmatimonadetes bacterium]|nr:MAG: hypothetical protein E2O47_03560 [Gemmatimonadota bacterium]